MTDGAAPVSKTDQRRVLLAVALSQVLALSLWFSASAVAPQLREAWSLSTGEEAGLTLMVLVGVAPHSAQPPHT